jgi:hypothetical protein
MNFLVKKRIKLKNKEVVKGILKRLFNWYRNGDYIMMIHQMEKEKLYNKLLKL